MDDPRSPRMRGAPGPERPGDDPERRLRTAVVQMFVVLVVLAVGVTYLLNPPRPPTRRTTNDRAMPRAPAPRPEASPEGPSTASSRTGPGAPGVAPPRNGTGSPGAGAHTDGEDLPKFGDYVYVDELPEALVRVPPEYPDLAREAGVSGTVMVQALVGRDGTVRDTRVVGSIPMLDAVAVRAVRQWTFKPAMADGKPVAVWVGIPVKFSLR